MQDLSMARHCIFLFLLLHTLYPFTECRLGDAQQTGSDRLIAIDPPHCLIEQVLGNLDQGRKGFKLFKEGKGRPLTLGLPSTGLVFK